MADSVGRSDARLLTATNSDCFGDITLPRERAIEVDVGTWWYYLENLKRWVTDHDLYAHDVCLPSSLLKIE